MSVFSKIVSREIPAHIVAETSEYLAFLDVSPLVMGHVLVIPKKEIDYIFDMDDETYLGLTIFAKVVANGLKKAFPCKKVGVAVIGLEVPHTHIHLIPMNNVSDMNFSKEKLKPSPQELAEAARKIKKRIIKKARINRAFCNYSGATDLSKVRTGQKPGAGPTLTPLLSPRTISWL